MVKGKLLVGWARGDITPPRKTLVQGQFHARISDRVVSPLTATALALEVKAPDGVSEQAVLLSCDLSQDAFKSDLLSRLNGRCPDLDLHKLTVNATHTHNAPAMVRGIYGEPENDPDFMNPDQYRLWLAERLAETVAEAWNCREPGLITRGFGYAVVGRCRRAIYADGTARMYGQTDRDDFTGLESCDDHALNLLLTRNGEGRLTGMVINLACPSQCDESESFFSADFWHNVREAVAERYGQNIHLLPQCAPAGDMSPHLMTDQTEEKDLRDRLGVDDKGVISRRIMATVADAIENAPPARKEVEFAHTVKTLRLPRIMVSDEEYELEKQIHHMGEDELARQRFGFQRVWPFGPVCDLITRYERQHDNPVHETEMHVIRLGDVAIATNPFELFVDYGMRIRCRSRALQSFLVQLADGSGNGFYLPTARALEGNHYSALTKSNWVGPEGGEILVDETVHNINKLFEDVDYPRTR